MVSSASSSSLSGTCRRGVGAGRQAAVAIRVGDHEVHAQTSGGENRLAGQQVGLTLKQYHVFDKASGTKLRSYH